MKHNLSVKMFRVIPPQPSTPDNISSHHNDLGTEPDSQVTAGIYTTFELMVNTFVRRPTSSFVLCSPFSDALDLPQEACLDSPRMREWEAAAAQYRTLFTYGIRSQHMLLRLPSRTSRSSVFGGP